jgi:hypothetical protein
MVGALNPRSMRAANAVDVKPYSAILNPQSEAATISASRSMATGVG